MPIRTTPFPQRPARFGPDEIQALQAALAKNELWYWQPNSVVDKAMKATATKFGAQYAVATSSGTASLHVAMAACQITPGFEVITTPITDIGTISAILYQNLIPVFADVDVDSSCLTVDTIRSAVTPRTRAVVVVHLTGCPVDIEPIAKFCNAHNIFLIEDCAQGLGARISGRSIGTFGDFGCYSLNDQKHITSGEGGFVIVNDEEKFYLCHNYADKYYDRHRRGVRLQALAPNYRMSELDGAMSIVQLHKLDAIVERRRILGNRLDTELSKIPGIIPQRQPADAEAAYFFYLFRLDERVVGKTRDDFVKQLGEEGIPARGAYVPVPIYKSPYFKNKSFFPGGVWPAEVVSGQMYDYNSVKLKSAELAVATGVTLNLHEGYSDRDIDDYIAAVAKVAGA